MRTIYILLFSLCCVFVLLPAQHGYAAIYKYLDKDGLISITNDLQSIPEQYRASAKVVSGDTDQENHQSIPNQQTPGQPTGNHEKVPGIAHDNAADTRNENSFIHNRMFLTAIIVVSAGFAFVILGILETEHKKAIAVVRVSLLWAVALYILIAHAGDAVRMIRTVAGSFDDAKHQSEERGKNAAKAIKNMNKLVEQVGETPSTDLPEESPGKKE
ncbi:MAG TPA: hypothetical protein VEI57_13250 [Nitrospirota bacterium]|nr:hypothetical protein [Nitrospirota bacterium]